MTSEYNDDALIGEFVIESRDHLASIEPDLLVLEEQGASSSLDLDLINRIFRAIHSIKGASGFFGFEHLKRLSHVMENLLMLVRDGQMAVSPTLVEALLKGVDKLNELLDDIGNSDTIAIDAEVQVLDALLNPGEAKSEAPAAAVVEEPAAPEPVAPVETIATPTLTPAPQPVKPLGGGTRYQLDVDPAKLSKPLDAFIQHLKSFGEVISNDSKDATSPCQIVIATVLDHELVQLATELSASQVTVVGGEAKPSAETAAAPEPAAPAVASVAPVIVTPVAAAPAQPVKPLGGGIRYQLNFDPAKDMAQPLDSFINHLKTFGEVVSVEQKDANGPCQIVVATVLDYELVQLATALPASKVTVLSADGKAEAPAAQKPATQPATAITSTKSAGQGDSPAVLPATGSSASSLAGAGSPSSPAKAPAAKSAASSHDANDSIRVRIDLLNKLMELAGEMVLSRNQLLRTLGEESSRANAAKEPSARRANKQLDTIVQNIDLITTDLQEHIMQTRMQPIGSVFSKFPRIVRDMAKQLDKEINLITQGEDVELDKSIIESLSDPLTHLIRNCCDHGLEPADEREQIGKPRSGAIRLRAFHQDGQINISIVDDGRGIDTTKLVAKALSKKLITEEQIKGMQPAELANLIFLPGLSTAEKVSDISGRGVGMDVVKTNITRLGGQIQIDTTPGEGTELLLRLPLTLAIIPSLIVGVAEQRFAVPQVNLVELLFVSAKDIAQRVEKVGSATVLRLRRQLLPLLKLSEILEIAPCENKASKGGYNIMVLRTGNQQFGVIVDELFDTEEIVVKSLSGFLKESRCFSGATIMGDGHVAMILDPNGIVAHSGLSFDAIESEQKKFQALSSQNNGNTIENMLLFNNAPSEVFAIPLKDVLRLEKFKTGDITRVGNREFINYDGKGLPIIRLESYLPVAPICREQTATEAYLIIPKENGGKFGIVVSKILDILETDCEWKPSADNIAGIAGWAVLQEHITVRLDLTSFLENVTHGSKEAAA